SPVLGNSVGRLHRLGVFHRVFHAGTAAILDTDAYASDRLLRARHHVLDAQRGRLGQPQPPWAGSGSRHGAPHRSLSSVSRKYYHILSTRRASSDMRLGSQGGSQTTSTLASLTPATLATAFSTWTGRSWAAGQLGEVSDISTFTPRSSPISIL